MNKNNYVSFTIAMIVCCACFAGADVSDSLDYQGYLTDVSGTPVSGPVEIQFNLYDAPSGGTSLWSDFLAVEVDNGLFTVRLGSEDNPLQQSDFESALWLGLAVEGDQEMTPRRQLSAVPFALRARIAEAVLPGAVCAPGDFINCYTGPAGTLDVGLCQSGTRTCAAGTGFGTCDGEITPSAEVCFDGQDNDCDGDVDEDCNCVIYRDADSDGFGDPAVFVNDCDGLVGYVNNDQDCFDQNAAARPGQTGFFPVDRGDGSYDYNCDGVQTRSDTVIGSCPSSPPCDATPGWLNFVPSCGQSGPRLNDCSQVFFECEAEPAPPATQACR